MSGADYECPNGWPCDFSVGSDGAPSDEALHCCEWGCLASFGAKDPDDLPDAMLKSACWSNGEPLTDIELSDVAEANPDWVQEMAMENNN